MTEDSVGVIVERIANLDKRVTDGQVRAEEWRTHFDIKLDARPCVVHDRLLSSVSVQLKGLWFLVGALITAMILEFIQR